MVTLESECGEDHDGRTEIRWLGFGPRELARASALVALAGPVAETLFRGGDETESCLEPHAWRADWDEADLQLNALSSDPSERDRLRRELLAELSDWFGDPDVWERTARIADALDAHESLDDVLFADAIS